MAKILAVLLCGLCLFASGAQAQRGRWVTFKLGHGARGRIEHQIDRNTIKPEGRFKSFWTQMWMAREKQALLFTVNEKLFFWSQKFLVDCQGRRFGGQFVDSNYWKEEKLRATPQTMRWESLDKYPAVGRTVCGEK